MRPPVRHDDPSTSHEAAEGADDLRRRLTPLIVTSLRASAARGAIVDEIWDYVKARTLVQGRDSIGPRMVEMEGERLICRHLIGYTAAKGAPIYEKRKSERTHRMQVIWWDYTVGVSLGYVDAAGPVEPPPPRQPPRGIFDYPPRNGR